MHGVWGTVFNYNTSFGGTILHNNVHNIGTISFAQPNVG